MAEHSFGRYFTLDQDAEDLFDWIRQKIRLDWYVGFIGICPVFNEYILNATFESRGDFDRFNQDYLDGQCNKSLIYTTRRHYIFIWNSASERRVNLERRSLAFRRELIRDSGRRASDDFGTDNQGSVARSGVKPGSAS